MTDRAETKETLNEEDAKLELELQELRKKVTLPYLEPLPQALRNHKVYTLVLDLDETLIHFEAGDKQKDEEGFYMIRPGCGRFLKELSMYYEIVVFTAAMPDYADWVLD
jgi:TFIIF-interacting CTD phosphatase-like protein